MAQIEMTRMPAISAVVAFRVTNAALNAASTFVAWNNERRTRAILSRLSAHELNDIGLCRGDIDVIARGGRI